MKIFILLLCLCSFSMAQNPNKTEVDTLFAEHGIVVLATLPELGEVELYFLILPLWLQYYIVFMLGMGVKMIIDTIIETIKGLLKPSSNQLT